VPIFTSPSVFAVGATLGAATLNSELSDNMTAVFEGLQSRAYNSANVSINNNTWTTFLFNTNAYDTAVSRGYSDPIHSTSSVTGRFTAPISGYWHVGATVQFTTNTTGARGIRGVHSNGTIIRCQDYKSATVGEVTCTCTALVYLAGAEYMTWEVFQNSGGALDALRQPDYSTVAWMSFNGGG
jgi:hypothetical protein